MSSSLTRRPTRQQAAVAELLGRSNDFTSAQTVHARLREAGEGVGLATVYRTLQAMVEAGAVDVLRTDDGEAVYRACSTHHHHHLVCRRCGAIADVDAPVDTHGVLAAARATGFQPDASQVVLRGLCADCAQPQTV